MGLQQETVAVLTNCTINMKLEPIHYSLDTDLFLWTLLANVSPVIIIVLIHHSSCNTYLSLLTFNHSAKEQQKWHTWTASYKVHFSCLSSFSLLNIWQKSLVIHNHWGNVYSAVDAIEFLPPSQFRREFLQSPLVSYIHFSLWCLFLDFHHSRIANVFVLGTASFKVAISSRIGLTD